MDKPYKEIALYGLIIQCIMGLMYWSFERLYIVSWLLGTPVSVLLLIFSFAYPQKIYEKISKMD